MALKKKLIEVALPLEAINKASAREKSIRHGHPSTLHLWWARRPLAAARAVIFAQMVDDPSAHPDLFPTEKAQEQERQRLFRLIEDLVKWENTTNEAVLQRARDEIWQSWRYTCAENADHPRARELFDRYKLPAFHDPFAGGGSLPLEAQRLGLESYASDLNPVAVLINKAMIEIPPRFADRPPVHPGEPVSGKSRKTVGRVSGDSRVTRQAAPEASGYASLTRPTGNRELFAREWKGAQGLAEDVRCYGQWMRDEAERRIGHLYPKIEITAEMVADPSNPRPDLKQYVGRKLTVIAWLWARTVKSPNPAFADVDVPLASTFMLSTKAGKEAYVEPVLENRGQEIGNSDVTIHNSYSIFSTSSPGYRFTVKVGKPKDAEAAKNGTKLARGANFQCLMSGTPIASEHIYAEANAGRMGARLMAIVAEGDRGRVYLAPTPEMEAIALTAQPTWKPEVAMPENPRWFSPPLYGLKTYGDLFTPRQLVALTTFSDLVCEVIEKCRADYLGTRASRPRNIHHRTRLPHFEAGETAQHLVFRLHDGLPANTLAAWKAELRTLNDDSARERERERRRRIEAALDQGMGACHLREPRIAEMVANALQHFDGTRYRLHEWVVMPNHVHVLITPLHGNSLSSIVHSWKSYTAKQANRLLGHAGAFWHEDYFDRFIRNQAHWDNTVEYVRNNPVKAGLCARAEEWGWGSAAPVVNEDERAGRPLSQEKMPLDEGGAGATAYAEAVGVYLGIALSRLTDICNGLCRWEVTKTQVRNLFGRQAIPMIWDFAENNVFGEAAGAYTISLSNMAKALDQTPAFGDGTALQEDAQNQSVSIGKLISTDPPYYDNIGYADLSDFFYVWLRRSLRSVFPDLFATLTVPKAEELVATPYRHGGKEKAEAFFLDGMTQAMRRLAEQAHPAFPVTIYYAFKQAETKGDTGTSSTGWDTFLAAVIEAGFAISGTWPMRTELGNRMIGSGTNALASSIVLVCRPRPTDAPTATRREFVAALKAELPGALRLLQGLPARDLSPNSYSLSPTTGIAPVDLAQAAIGPGMAVYTRYAKVLDAEGQPLPVRAALALINQTLDEALAEQEGDFDADSRWALTWFEHTGFAEGDYGVAEQLSKSKNTSVSGLAEAGILVSKAGKVRLLKPAELPAHWDPTADQRLTVWEMVHHLIRVLEAGGEGAAAALVARLGSQAETARELCYRLYVLSDRKKRANEALAYNGLVQSWPEITRLARETPGAATPGTGDLFDLE